LAPRVDQRRHRKRSILLGFSLLELMVVIVLIGGLIAIIVPSIQSLSGLEIKNEITKIAGLSSEVYALAAISGKTHRIIFDLDNQKYWVEEKVAEAGEIKPDLGYEDLMRVQIKKNTAKEATGVNRFIPSYKQVEGSLGEKYELARNLVFHGVWTEEMNEIARAGHLAIYFFSGGYTQLAFVSLAIKGEEEESSIYMALSPLTGAVKIDYGEPNINELPSSEGSKEP
jgi:prepilin-type N-terminal cleavage/methylation domain-containing protein